MKFEISEGDIIVQLWDPMFDNKEIQYYSRQTQLK